MQAQEGQWDFAQKSRGHDWTCSSSSLCHTAGHYTTCAAHTLMSVFVWSFFFCISSNASLNPCRSFLNPYRFVFSRRKHGLTDQSPWLLVRIFLAPHCSCTTDALTAAAYFLITIEDPHKTVYTRQAMIPLKSCTLDPSRRLQQTLSPLTSNISCLVEHSSVCASKERELILSHLG